MIEFNGLAIFIIFIFYSVFWLQIPGQFFASILLPKRAGTATRLLSGYFLGFTILAIIYYIQSAIGAEGIITAAGPIFSIIAIIYWLKKGCPLLDFENKKALKAFIVVFILLYTMSFLAFQLPYVHATEGVTTQVYHDQLYHTGNIITLSRSFPNTDIRVYGITFYYHYFTDLVFAMCKHIFGMSAFDLYMNCNAFAMAWPLGLALVMLGKRIAVGVANSRFAAISEDGETKLSYHISLGRFKEVSNLISGKRFLFYSLGALISLMCVYPAIVVGAKLPISWMNNHFFTNGNGMGHANAIFVLMLELIVMVWYEKYSHKTAVLLFLLMLATTGFKGPTGILVVAVAWAVFFVQMLIEFLAKKQNKELYKARFLYCLWMSIAFVISYMLVDVGINTANSNNRSTTLSPSGTLEASRVGEIFERVFGLDYEAFPWIVPAIILCAVVIVGPIIFPLIGFIVEKAKDLFKNLEIGDIYDWFAIGAILISLGGYCAITIEGISQGYLVINTSFLIFYCAVKYLSGRTNIKPLIIRKPSPEKATKEKATEKNKNDFRTRYYRFSYKWMQIFWILGLICFVADACNYVVVAKNQYLIYNEDASESDALVSSETMAAYFWLRDNTDEDSLVAVDVQTENLDYREIYFYCSAFSERQIYIEGYDYTDVAEGVSRLMLEVNECFYDENPAISDFYMEKYGINYLVVTEKSNPDYVCNSDRLTLVFESETAKIYKFE